MQLQQEEDNRNRRAAQQPQPQHYPSQQQSHGQTSPTPQHSATAPQQSVYSVLCPNCQATNNVAHAQLHLQHMCGLCNRVLPGIGNGQPPQQQIQRPASGAPAGGGTRLAFQCPYCAAVNNLTTQNPTQPTKFRCGSCSAVLQAPAQQPAPQRSPGGTVQQGVLVQSVRCGNCPAINSVKGGPGTQFKCGSCSAVNEIPGHA